MPRHTSTDPWRAVFHIAERSGARGGKAWFLVTECGHLVVRQQRRPRFPTTKIERFTAPERVRCVSCGLGTPPGDPQAWITTLTQGEQP